MKRETSLQNQTKNQNPNSIKDALTGPFKRSIGQQPKTGLHKFFESQNRGKGPPGRSRSPGPVYCSLPDIQPVALKDNNNHLLLKFNNLNKHITLIFITIKFLKS
jgi:hypothetical protein